MRINQAGFELIKRFEGEWLTSYLCPAGVWTIGFGHTGSDVRPGMSITHAQAEEMLERDISRFEDGVARAVTVPISGNQFSALVSFAFNVGLGAIRRSTLLRKLNSGDSAGAAHEFLRWDKSGGRVLPGLTRRRLAERELFETPGDGHAMA